MKPLFSSKLCIGLLMVWLLGSACATITNPSSIYHPTVADGDSFFEIGALANISTTVNETESSKNVEKVKAQDSGTGAMALFQHSNYYMRIEGEPLPGTWFGFGKTRDKARSLSWYPAIEISLVSKSTNNDEEQKRDGYMVDGDGNRYLYEITQSSGGIGVASPQILEIYPVKKVGLYAVAVPTFIHNSKTTEVELAYERDRRMVRADPDLDAQFQDIERDLQRDDHSSSTFSMPLVLGVRAQLNAVHFRLSYCDRSLDSKKDFESRFKRTVMASVGYRLQGKTRDYSQPAGPAPAKTQNRRNR